MYFNLAISDIYANNCKISHYIGDNPKRSQARQCLSHSSWYPCEYCVCKGTKIVTNDIEIEKKKKHLQIQKKIVHDKIMEIEAQKENEEEEEEEETRTKLESLRNIEKELIDSEKKLKPKKSNIVWPETSSNGTPRTLDQYFDIYQQIENNQPLTPDEAQGVVGRSLLFDIRGFHFIRDIPVDYLHCVCLGSIKRCVELTFRVGEVRTRITKRPLSPPILFNRQIHGVKVPRESNRRIRDLDFAVYKGQEFRNLLLFFSHSFLIALMWEKKKEICGCTCLT